MNQTRTIHAATYSTTLTSVTEPVAALREYAASGRYTLLLAHADDGVIWGRVTDGQLVLSHEAFPTVSPALRTLTLQQARLFGPAGEVFVWRTAAGWQSRAIIDGTGTAGEAFDEDVMLWGTNDGLTPGTPQPEERHGFWLALEADLGLRHTPPLKMTQRHSLRLQMRHYLAYDDYGAAFVKLSRLVDLTNGGAA